MTENDTQAKRVIISTFGWILYVLGVAILALVLTTTFIEKFITQVGNDVTSQFLWLALVPYLVLSGGGIAFVTNAMGPKHLPGKIGRWAFWILGLIAIIIAFIEPPN